MTRPIRVLELNGGSLDYGGISTFLLSYASHMDPKKVQIDFLVHGQSAGPRENEALALGCQVIHVPNKREHYLKNRLAIQNACHGYDIVHAHMDGMNGYVLQLAKRSGVPIRISHSHNTGFLTNNPIRVWLHRKTANRIPRVATTLFACSEAAGKFLYGATALGKEDVVIIRNAIELDRYAFQLNARTRIRAELNVENAFVIGNIGRYDYQKNQEFLLNILPQLLLNRPNIVLVLIGDGADRTKLEAMAAEKDLAKHVRFTGYRNDVPALLSAMDGFALPSHFEGLGIVLIEAQRSGLPCIASDQVPMDTQVLGCQYLPLDQERWISALTGMQCNENRDTVGNEAFQRAGYDIVVEAEKLQNRYLELAGR